MDAEKRKNAHQASLASRRKTALNRARTAQRMASDGISVSKIAERLGVKPRTISKDLKKDLTLLVNNPDLT